MTTFQLRPVRAAILALIAQAASAQTTGDQVTPAAPTQPAQIQQVTVTGLRSSIRSAEAIKRDAVQVVDSINAEDIGKFPDRAAGDALQRIAGVQVGRDRGETRRAIEFAIAVVSVAS